ncbi:hypothetical protein [Robiginitalea sp. SC105]|uniref:hypothetical protein n=1 Tax=Robiginitalea sp. SC105 TaxID=2762332 RepID=UPI00163993CE|nr:hypothetical protein [Robiginitalea sp. SC105]MBC2840085.1 hypothetical protein [Robiginitalea sp. SC105]
MVLVSTFLYIAHVVGVALGVGAATVKLVLLLKSKSDHTFILAFLKVVKPITRLIISGLVILTLSGIGWLIMGYTFTPLLIAKIVLVALTWVLGPIIDNVAEPKFVRLAPGPEENASQEFVQAHKQYVTLELAATSLFYIILVIGVLL